MKVLLDAVNIPAIGHSVCGLTPLRLLSQKS